MTEKSKLDASNYDALTKRLFFELANARIVAKEVAKRFKDRRSLYENVAQSLTLILRLVGSDRSLDDYDLDGLLQSSKKMQKLVRSEVGRKRILGKRSKKYPHGGLSESTKKRLRRISSDDYDSR